MAFRLLNAKQVADKIGVSTSMIYAMKRAGLQFSAGMKTEIRTVTFRRQSTTGAA